MNFKDLHIHGEVRTDLLHRILYSTDASAYRETPLAVAFPKDETDVQEIVRYASRNHINLIPRAGRYISCGAGSRERTGSGYFQIYESYFGNKPGGTLG